MKKHQLLAAALVFMIGTTAYAQEISVYIGEKNVKPDTSVQIKDDTAYIPISFVAKEMGSEIKWEAPKVIITKGSDQITFVIGEKTAYKNGTQLLLSETPYISNDRAFVSSSDISELLDCSVDYQKPESRINISEKDPIKEKMDELGVLNYCVVGDWVYYVTLGDQEGFHKMLSDGSQNTVIHDLSGIDVNGSTAVTSQYENGFIIYKFQQMSQYDENGVLEAPAPSFYYKLNLTDNTLTAFNDNKN